jgi:glycosyltransferase involved in cell wall biosynthesis
LSLPIVAQDPRFGGGFRSFATAFWNAVSELGRDPRLVYLSRERGLSPRMRSPRFEVQDEEQAPFHGNAVPSFVPELDALNQLVGGERIARRIRSAPLAWVVAASAPYGWGAYRSGRPYGCWLATGLADEWAAGRDQLPRSKRLALALNKPALLGMERAVVRGARVVATISQRSRGELAGATGLPEEQIVVWPIPVDLAEFAPLDDAAWEAALEQPTIVFVGRANDPRKNVALLLEAFALVHERIPEARLRLVGEPPSIGRLGAGVEVAGEVDSVAEAVRDAAVLVLPSLQEGFGIVVAEAFACAVPAVVTPCGGPEDLVRRSGGGIVLNGWSAAGVADTVVDLLGDRDRLLAMRAAARAYVEREHSPEHLRDIVQETLREIEAQAQ